MHLIHPTPVRERERDVDRSQLNISFFKQHLSETVHLNGVHQSVPEHLIGISAFILSPLVLLSFFHALKTIPLTAYGVVTEQYI